MSLVGGGKSRSGGKWTSFSFKAPEIIIGAKNRNASSKLLVKLIYALSSNRKAKKTKEKKAKAKKKLHYAFSLSRIA